MNLYDVAKRARVSIATVSRVLNDSELVKGPTRARVQRALEELNYHPNVNARSLSAAKSRTLGVIVSNLANQYFLDVFLTLEGAAHREGYELLVANTDYSPERLVTSVRLMLGRRVNGLAVVVSEMDAGLIDELAASKTRVVFSGVDTPGHNFTNVKVNTHKGMQRILEHLGSFGHRRIGFIGHHAVLETISERRKAFLESTDRLGREFESVTFSDSDSLAGGRQAARDILASGFRPTAIVCVNDLMALGVLKEFRERGIGVPRDISVTGFDDIEFAEASNPALTTAHIPRERIGRLLFESLMRQRAGRTAAQEIVIDPELVLRESTGPAPAD